MVGAAIAHARRRRFTTLAFLAAATAGVLVGTNLAGANSPPSATTQVDFVPVGKVLTTRAWFSPGQVKPFVMIGGSTTVPTNATTVQLQVYAEGPKAGSLSIYPTGNPAGVSPDTVSWQAADNGAGRVAVNIGLNNKVDVKNVSTGAARVTLIIVGYSTQATAGTINGSGGTAGQVLTNNGPGTAVWKRLLVKADDVLGTGGTAGQVLTNNGSAGSVWTTLPPFTKAAMRRSTFEFELDDQMSSLSTIFVSPGSYLVIASGTARSDSPDQPNRVHCALAAPRTASPFAVSRVSLTPAAPVQQIQIEGLITATSGLSVSLGCRAETNLGFLDNPRIIVLQVSSATGATTVNCAAPPEVC